MRKIHIFIVSCKLQSTVIAKIKISCIDITNYMPFLLFGLAFFGGTPLPETILIIYIYVHCTHYGPNQVKCQLIILSIFDAMNFRKMLEIHCIKNKARMTCHVGVGSEGLFWQCLMFVSSYKECLTSDRSFLVFFLHFPLFLSALTQKKFSIYFFIRSGFV